MSPLDVLTPLDLARGATLRLLARSPLLTRVLGRRDTRIAVLGSLQVALLFALAVRWPVAMYFLGPVTLGVVHLAADVRYLALRQPLPSLLLRASVALALGLTVVRVCVGLSVASGSLGAAADLAVGAAWVGLALVMRFRDQPGRLALVAPPFFALVALMFARPGATDVALTHLHNLAAFGLWLGLFRRREGKRGPGWAVMPLVVALVACAVLMSGAWLPFALRHGGLVAFGQRAARLGAGLAPGAPARFAAPIAATFVFLQSVHYAVWTGWIAQDALPGEGTPTFRMTARALHRDLGAAGLACVVVLTVGLAAAACVSVRESVAWYMTLARAHVWFELAAFAYLVGRPSHAAARVARPTPRASTSAPARAFGVAA